jgi:hypothetical protein
MSVSISLLTVRIVLGISIAVLLAHSAVQTQTLTKKELKALAASAKTTADHERIAEYYRSEANRLEAKQREHEQQLAEYYKNPVRYPSKYPTG